MLFINLSIMTIETNESVETSESQITEELKNLKESIVTEAINEITKWDSNFFWKMKKKLLQKYLINNWKRRESIEDKILESIFIPSEVKKLKEDLSKAKTAAELKEIQSSFIHDLEVIEAEKEAKKDWKKERKKSDKEHYEIDQFNITISQEHQELYSQLQWPEKPDIEPFACAIKWYETLKSNLKNPKYLTVVDFTKSNSENRFYVINMTNKTVEYATTVWHWQWSWTWEFATSFSDISWSNQSSLWFFRTPDSLFKPTNRKWSWLLMNGIEDSNDSAKSRWIYMHPGWKISQWCFTLPKSESSDIMNKVKWDSLLFAYAKSKDYFSQSKYFQTNSTWDVLSA